MTAADPAADEEARAPAPPEVSRALLDACRAGDPDALTAFVRRYQSVVFAFLSRTLGVGGHVEDLAQEVFLRACRGLASFDPGGAAKPSTWLLTIASRVARDARRKRTFSSLDPAAASHLVSADTPESERHRAEIGDALARAASALSDEHREVFVLAELHALDTRAIAGVLGIREATVKTRLFRARERLREMLQPLWDGR